MILDFCKLVPMDLSEKLDMDSQEKELMGRITYEIAELIVKKCDTKRMSIPRPEFGYIELRIQLDTSDFDKKREAEE